MKLQDIAEGNDEIVRKEQYHIDQDSNKYTITIGERASGKKWIGMHTDDGVAVCMSTVMFKHQNMGYEQARDTLKNALQSAFSNNEDIVSTLKTVTQLDGWKKV